MENSRGKKEEEARTSFHAPCEAEDDRRGQNSSARERSINPRPVITLPNSIFESRSATTQCSPVLSVKCQRAKRYFPLSTTDLLHFRLPVTWHVRPEAVGAQGQ